MRFPTATMLAAALAMAWPGLAPSATAPAAAATVPTKVVETQAAMRDLWLGHIFWVRNVVDARLENDASEAKAAEQQVVDNAKAIAGAIEPYYGEAASEKLFGLLAGHWGAISAYLDATHAGKKADQDAAFKKLVDNAGSRISFADFESVETHHVGTLRPRARTIGNFRHAVLCETRKRV